VPRHSPAGSNRSWRQGALDAAGCRRRPIGPIVIKALCGNGANGRPRPRKADNLSVDPPRASIEGGGLVCREWIAWRWFHIESSRHPRLLADQPIRIQQLPLFDGPAECLFVKRLHRQPETAVAWRSKQLTNCQLKWIGGWHRGRILDPTAIRALRRIVALGEMGRMGRHCPLENLTICHEILDAPGRPSRPMRWREQRGAGHIGCWGSCRISCNSRRSAKITNSPVRARPSRAGHTAIGPAAQNPQ
jgi:hypothetical protein